MTQQKLTHLQKILPTEEDMLAFGSQFANAIESGAILFLYGPLGAGKTTLTRGFLRGLGFTEKVKSPTYTLVEQYEIAGHILFHFDFYRLEDARELEQIGIQEYFSPSSICLIEWPEKGVPLLPEPDLACYIAFAEEGREIKLVSYSDRGERILKKLISR
ncbi:tRNA (adenosine(37)-N6)-threonylcarbamoyltransferase complex ATPase subunit type 1 TsaE [Aquicella lusitana]|uniref:tRNA threonylcarbamoyladenosine biosynthesis protein TsaE n=1 Tax=Aquicella lusitana TaxID=254246 RepID=A0A370GE37_9COXI|nr:tRNA (adenosine(37)-N6)-threonylcarbamoyltransferase complex ATPase subunit type 1 TsaE [Aquicella lusitana]RDI41510.1 tRNA threonylcarbamoyladenosine biosynthesis protein TsaE [Aquicella lusitana]VVC72596.1 tRNA threonylcarbamoyladenosine biosynthesis protein TsaE [Aquicella lusitana]